MLVHEGKSNNQNYIFSQFYDQKNNSNQTNLLEVF